MIQTLGQKGYGVGELFIVLLIFGALGAGGYTVVKSQQSPTKDETSSQPVTQQQQKSEEVSWTFNEDTKKWQATGKPPACNDPLLKVSPVDTTKAESVLYPGQYRGGNYKPHGGFAFSSPVDVVAPLDAKLTGLVRYMEVGRLQYKATFQNDCGVAFYFDHLNTLSPELMKVAETTTPPTESTVSLPLTGQQIIAVTAGQLLATNNSGIDFGVLDLRQANEISKNPTWSAIHNTYVSSEWYGICWFDALPAVDTTRVKALPPRDFKSGTRSDYCSNPTGTTLDINDGKPV